MSWAAGRGIHQAECTQVITFAPNIRPMNRKKPDYLKHSRERVNDT